MDTGERILMIIRIGKENQDGVERQLNKPNKRKREYQSFQMREKTNDKKRL